MGEVRDAIQGDGGSKRKAKAKSGNATNLLSDLQGLMDEISELAQVKEADTLKEGDAEKAENDRKVGILKACHSLAVHMRSMLEDY